MNPAAAGERPADYEPDPGRRVLDERDQDRERNRDQGDDQVLAIEVRLGTLLHSTGDLLHALVARRETQQPLRDERAVEHRGARADERDQDAVIGQEIGHRLGLRRGCVSKNGRAVSGRKAREL